MANESIRVPSGYVVVRIQREKVYKHLEGKETQLAPPCAEEGQRVISRHPEVCEVRKTLACPMCWNSAKPGSIEVEVEETRPQMKYDAFDPKTGKKLDRPTTMVRLGPNSPL